MQDLFAAGRFGSGFNPFTDQDRSMGTAFLEIRWGRASADALSGELEGRPVRPGSLRSCSEDDYDRALAEIRSERKQHTGCGTCFPQFDGLGFSAMAKQYAIRSAAETEQYLRHPILGPRLVESCQAALSVEGQSAFEIFGSPDDMKLRSCATLCAAVSPPESVFRQVLDRFFGGEPDEQTVRLLRRTPDRGV